MSNTKELAIDGGAPVRSEPMPARRALGDAEVAKLNECVEYYRSQDVDPGYQGPFEDAYCEAFAAYQGGGFADAVATGTASVYVSVRALSLPEGAEILVSPITDPGTLSAIILAGCRPKLVDSAPMSFSAGVTQFMERTDERTRAMIFVHAAGQPTDLRPLRRFCDERDIRLIEDCSQAHGAESDGEKVGRFGHISCFSTMYRKAHMTGASGGVVYSLDIDLYRMALVHADRGKPRWREDFDDRDPSGYLAPALNLHADELSCAIGQASLARLDETRRARLSYLQGVQEGLRTTDSVCRGMEISSCHSPFYYPVFVDTVQIRQEKTRFAEAVRAEGIGLNPDYRYLVEDWAWIQPYLVDSFKCESARAARDSAFCLYVNERYGKPEVEDTLASIDKVTAVYRK